MSNVQTVQEIYAAFGRGDIATILSHLTEDVLWEYDKTDAGIPWLTPRHGRVNVPQFFEALGDVAFETFQPKTLLESGNRHASTLALTSQRVTALPLHSSPWDF